MSARKYITLRVRYAVLERDGYRCRYCGAEATDAKLHVDHRMPVSKGGTNDFENLVTACSDCNLGKHAFLPTRYIPAQRENALAAVIFQRMCERFGAEVPFWLAFCTILNFCQSEPDPDPLLQIVLEAETYEAAIEGMYRYGGYPDGTDIWAEEE
jgi:hypothetical protein